MNDYWYIWFEIYENGMLVSRNRYHRPYTYKQSAERRAKQMWSQDLYIPMTNTIIKRKWIISKTDPWDLIEGE